MKRGDRLIKIRRYNRRGNGRSAALLLSLLLILGVAAGGTLALLAVSSGTIGNSFKTVAVTSKVEETFNNTTKSNVKIRNTGDIDAWIRVAVIPTWEDGSGNVVNQTASLNDLSISISTGSWFKGSDGYYYCKSKIAPNALTPVLINSAAVKTSSDGYKMNLQILCEAIQAEPESAVADAWNAVQVNGGQLASK
ncbi:MAG: hypothetical protein GXY01_10560 [Clostridiales bacterium]|jgi:hypothetical protein|nr:hypothetical protein [Clostridiales bacterium]